MTFDEAISKVIDIIPEEQITEFDEVVETLKNENTSSADAVDWEAKYRELSEVYKKRFKESLNTEVRTDVTEDEKEEEPKTVDVGSLDFSAETE